MTAAGYSGTPLARKLGIREGDDVRIVDDPGHARALLGSVPEGVAIADGLGPAAVILFFTRERSRLEAGIALLGEAIFPAGACWIAWPKRASKVTTDMTEDVVREVALPLGLVDNKVCAIDDTWSGLRLVWRKERR
jgi:nucleoside-diphosphate-sugar epimerase